MPVLTDAAVRKYAPQRKRREISDSRTAGLHLVLSPTGHKAWALRFRRPDGRNAKLTLGPHCFSGQELTGNPVMGQPLTLAAARLLAADIHRQRKMGIDVVGEYAARKRRSRIEREQADATVFGVLARQFIAEHCKPHVRRWRETAYVLGLRYPLDGDGEPTEARDGLAERWADKPVSAIDASLIYMAVDEARRRGVPGTKRRNPNLSDARGRKFARALSGFFSWLVQHRKIAASPCVGMYVPSPPASRERVLSADEIRWFWQGCDAVGAPFGPMCKLLLLCGVRREEARAMTRAEISADGTAWSLAGSRTKNGRPHVVPLSPIVREIICTMPLIEGTAGYVFTLDGKGPIAGIAKNKRKLDAAMLAAAREERGGAAIQPWRLHDLRRTFVTGLIELGVAPHVTEAAVNHLSGTRGGVAGVYNKAELLPERRAALERWAAHVHGLVSGGSENVVPMPRKGA